jgi:hypothetical protein
MRGWHHIGGVRYGVPLVLGALALVTCGHAAWGSRAGESTSGRVAPKAPLAPVVAPRPVSSSGPLLLEDVTIRPAPHPLDGLTDRELDALAKQLPESLGPVCVGRPNRGRLFNAEQLLSEPGLRVMGDKAHSFGSSETVRVLRAVSREVRAAYPDSEMMVGDISRARGGYLRPHRSHQLGVDVDLGYFYLPPSKWYQKANAENLDRPRTWALLKALIAQGSVEYVFMDRGVQGLLREYATSIGEANEWLDTLFESRARRDTLFRHTRGHATHLHVRFLDPAAEKTGRRLQARLRRVGRL